ncbi:MAG TPA: c-type cytochrome domain-containing protein [Planctomycetaceae bacterium]|nr:c-type cytochrome domain-containing protein [Planctomycetaceae bacterium]
MSVTRMFSFTLFVFATMCLAAGRPSQADDPAALVKQVEQAAARETEARQALDAVRSEVAAVRQKVEQLTAGLEAARAELAQSETRRAQLPASAEQARAERAAALGKLIEEAAARRQQAEQVLSAAREKEKSLTDALGNVQTDLAKAQSDLKSSEERLKTEQEALKKATEEQAALEKAAGEAHKSAEAADAEAKAALERAQKAAEAAKAAQEKALAAAKAAESAQTAVKTTEQSSEAAKAVIAAAPERTKQVQAQLEQFKPELDKAQDAFAAVSREMIDRQRALDALLIESGRLVSFAESVAPIFARRCLACHNARTAKGRYNMETFAAIVKGGESGEAVVAGDSDGSNLFGMVEAEAMPKDADPLSTDELAAIQKWIVTGAKLDAGLDPNAPLITIMPKQPQPAPPESYRVPVPVTALAFSPDGTLLASSGYHELLVWNAADGQLVRRITNVAERVYDIEFSPDGQRVAVAAGTPAQIGEAKIFNLADGALLHDLVATDDSVFAVAFSPDGGRLASAGADRTIRVYDASTGQQQHSIEDHADWVMDVAWSPDGAKLASASRDKTSKVFDATTGDSLVTFNGHGEPVFGVAFSPDGAQVVTSGRDKQIRIWKADDAAEARKIGGFGNEVFRLHVTAEGLVYSSSADKTARVHKLADGAQVRAFSGHQDWVYSVAFHPGTKKVASGSYDGEVRLWNADDGAGLATFIAAPGYKPPEATAAAGK